MSNPKILIKKKENYDLLKSIIQLPKTVIAALIQQLSLNQIINIKNKHYENNKMGIGPST